MDADKPKPGSPDAIKQGCVCPILDNAHGAGVGGDGGKFGWWISGYCPLHGEENGNSPQSTR